MSEDSDAFIREIQEEVRRDKLTKLWNQYGTLLIGGLAAFVLLVGGWQWYSAYTLDLTQKAGGRFEEAISLLDDDKAEKKKDGVALLENLTKDAPKTYALLAKLRLAANHRTSGEEDKALPLYQAVVDNTSADPMLRSFAKLQIAAMKVDTGTWTDTQNRLNDLAKESGPWRFTARELLGVAAFKHKKWKQAREAYSSLLTEASAPAAMKQRAQAALALITREEVVATPPAQEGGQKDAAKSDLKKDKSPGNDGKSTTESGGTAAKSEPSNEASAESNESKPKQN